MILIINGQKDESTDNICKWLLHYEKEFIRIDEKCPFTKININLVDGICEIEINNNRIIDLTSIKSVFYKNGSFNYKINSKTKINKFIKDYNSTEWKILDQFLRLFIQNESNVLIGNLVNYEVNKLEVLNIAKQIGLKIPETYIVSSKANLLKLVREKKYLITKSIGDMSPLYLNDDLFLNYTREINKSEKIFHDFMPSLVQVKIEKKYEIRTFFIKDLFWSIAIFSQENSNSKIDNRINNSNHSTSFKLPINLEKKIIKLAKRINLNSGSVDWICSTEGDFFFLEINPLGVFSNVSTYGHYNIEREIAKIL